MSSGRHDGRATEIKKGSSKMTDAQAPSIDELVKGFESITDRTEDVNDENESATSITGLYTAPDGSLWKVKYYLICGDMYDAAVLWQEA